MAAVAGRNPGSVHAVILHVHVADFVRLDPGSHAVANAHLPRLHAGAAPHLRGLQPKTYAEPYAHRYGDAQAASVDTTELKDLKAYRRSPFSGECLLLVATIIQHETGSMKRSDVWNFMADQITYDAARMGCHNLTQWRWAIKSRPRPLPEVMLAARHWPHTYPKCQFVGMPPDVKVWRAAGFKIKIDYQFESGPFKIVGANCASRTKSLLTFDREKLYP